MERALKYHISFILNKSLSEYSIISGCILKRMKISYSEENSGKNDNNIANEKHNLILKF